MRPLALTTAAVLVGAALLVSGCTAPPSPASPPATPPLAYPPATPAASPAPAAAGEEKVRIPKNAILAGGDPAKAWDRPEIRIKAGTTVVWTNGDTLPHDVTFASGPETPKSGPPGSFQPGQSWSHTFTKPGTYIYECHIHSGLMNKFGVGPTVVVE